MIESHVMTLPDGRDLGWLEVGDLTGRPVVALHASPGSRREIAPDESVPRDAGVRLICVDRPGYGLSSFHARRRLVDWPSDVVALAEHVGLDEFSILAHSGGGPHALACASLLGERVRALAVVGGVAPLDDKRALGSMTRANQRVMSLARRRSPVVRLVASAQMTLFHYGPEVALKVLAHQLPAPDATIISRPLIHQMYVTAGKTTSRHAARALAQDFELFSSPWGFDLSTIVAPVYLWHGDDDRNVPFEHARLLHEQLAHSHLREVPDAGHLLIYSDLERILRELVAT